MPLFWHTACTTIIVSKRLTEKQTSFINYCCPLKLFEPKN